MVDARVTMGSEFEPGNGLLAISTRVCVKLITGDTDNGLITAIMQRQDGQPFAIVLVDDNRAESYQRRRMHMLDAVATLISDPGGSHPGGMHPALR